ncbi:MAG: hypothetical protein Q7W30_01435 [Coriobacteriia bacterium]|nr:hypothetical protein [Coriobacteriia bacterium]
MRWEGGLPGRLCTAKAGELRSQATAAAEAVRLACGMECHGEATHLPVGRDGYAQVYFKVFTDDGREIWFRSARVKAKRVA